MPTEDEYKKLKVVELKELLKERGLPVSGKKDDLISRLLESDPDGVTTGDDNGPMDDLKHPNTATKTSSDNLSKEDAPIEVLPGGKDQPAWLGPASTKEAIREKDTVSSASKDVGSQSGMQSDIAQSVRPNREAARTTDQKDLDLKTVTHSSNGHTRAESKEMELPLNDRAAKRMRVASPSVEDIKVTSIGANSQSQTDEIEPPEYQFEPEAEVLRPTDMYLDTINRPALDFDFERLCSVTLSQNHIYACLTDGKYFQGRGKSSPAYAHSIAEDHHVYINLTTHKVYVLPDGYEVNDPSLADIKYLLFPTFTPSLLSTIDISPAPYYDLTQQPYYPGFVGLNNIKANSYMNAVLHSLVHVPPIRDYFILNGSFFSDPTSTELVKRFSMLCRKIWNPKAFKSQVSPHEFLQECSNRSGKRFKITENGDPLEFLGWVLNSLHQDLGGSRKKDSSIIYKTFQGEVKIDDQQILTKMVEGSGSNAGGGNKPTFDLDRDVKSTQSPFLFLTIDLPPPPLFQDAIEKNIIPQVPLSAVLSKYDGVTTLEETTKGILRRFKLTRLPPFIILHIKRFTKNNFVQEKNPTIVNFPLRGVDFKDYVVGDASGTLSEYYDLVSNVTHSTTAGTAKEETSWKVHVHTRPPRDSKTGKLLPQTINGKITSVDEDAEKWFQIQDLIVEEINRNMISLGETYLQIWERRRR